MSTMSFIQDILSESIYQWFDTMLNSLNENRCYYIAATLVSLGVTYFIKRLFLAVKPKEENFKPIDLDTAETSKYSLEINSSISEKSNTTTKCEADYMELDSRSSLNHYKTLNSLVSITKRDALPLNESESDQPTSETYVSNQEAATSELEFLPSEVIPISVSEIVPFKENLTPELDISQPNETPTSELEILPSGGFPTPDMKISSSEKVLTLEPEILSSEKVRTSEFEILSSDDVPKSQLEILPTEEILTPECEILQSEKVSTSELQILLSKESLSGQEILQTDFPMTKHSVLPLESLLDMDILHSKPRTFEPKTKSSDTIQIENVPEGLLHTELDKLKSECLACEIQSSETLYAEHGKSENKIPSERRQILLSIDDPFKEKQILDITIRYAQQLKQEVLSKSSTKHENVLSNELSGKTKISNSSTNSSANEFPLDIIPLEMIYNVLPLNTR